VILSIAVVEDGRLREVDFPGSASLASGLTDASEGHWMSESWGAVMSTAMVPGRS
jgi:hypothetical protein